MLVTKRKYETGSGDVGDAENETGPPRKFWSGSGGSDTLRRGVVSRARCKETNDQILRREREKKLRCRFRRLLVTKRKVLESRIGTSCRGR